VVLQKLSSSIQWKNLRRATLNGATHCHACGREFDLSRGPMAAGAPTMGHILPVKHYPSLALDPANVRPECFGCNRRKGARRETKPRGHSRNWFPHEPSTVLESVVTMAVVLEPRQCQVQSVLRAGRSDSGLLLPGA
jgi:5-methylcytosine-specific restriction endonuclease McrA